jgi:hypothetical protein
VFPRMARPLIMLSLLSQLVSGRCCTRYDFTSGSVSAFIWCLLFSILEILFFWNLRE